MSRLPAWRRKHLRGAAPSRHHRRRRLCHPRAGAACALSDRLRPAHRLLRGRADVLGADRLCGAQAAQKPRRSRAAHAGGRRVFDPADPATRKAVLKASGGIYAAVDFAGSDKSLAFATSVLAKGGKVVVTGLIGGGYATAVAMFPLKAMTIEGTQTGTLQEARELIDLVREKNMAPPPIAERQLGESGSSARPRRHSTICARGALSGGWC
ncbi:MAG: zinc-binding dehydrogenase [Pseudolabrys sp.]